MNSSDLQLRLKKFAYRVVTVCEQLPKKKVAAVIEHQALRSTFATAANYRASCKAISQKVMTGIIQEPTVLASTLAFSGKTAQNRPSIKS